MKNSDAIYEYMKGIILYNGIHIVSLCEADDSLINATHLITASVDITLSRKDTLNALSKHKFYLVRISAHSCHKFSVVPYPL
jgi:hypothetical protein